MLHRVVPAGRTILNPRYMVDAQMLDDALWLTRQMGWEIVTLDEVHRRMRERDFSRGLFACFTSDDGYLDNLTVALPVFRRHGAPFAVYPCTSAIDRTLLYWWGALEEVVLGNDSIELPEEIPGVPRTLQCRTLEEKENALGVLDEACHRHGPAMAAPLWRRYRVDPEALLDRDALSVEQVRELAADPLVTIGAHSVTHRRLSQLSLEDCRRELVDSRQELQQMLDAPINHLAYPFGGPDACGVREFELAAQLGFKTAVTTRRGNLFESHGEHLTALPRRNAAVNRMQHRNALNGMDSFLLRANPVQVV